MKEEFWMYVETVRTSGKLDEFIKTLKDIKKVYPDLVLTYDCNLEFLDYSTEITEIRIVVNKDGKFFGLITGC